MKYISYKKDTSYILDYKSDNIAITTFNYINKIIKDINISSKLPLSIKYNNDYIYMLIDNDYLYAVILDYRNINLINSTIISRAPLKIKEDKIKDSYINTLAEGDYNTLIYLIEEMIDNLGKDINIYLNKDIDIRLLKLALYLIPNSYISYIDISNSYNTYISYKEFNGSGIYIEYNPSYPINIKRYTYTIIDSLKISLNEALKYKDRIDSLIVNNNINMAEVCDLLNLMDAHIERINSIAKLNKAIECLDRVECNKAFIANILFTSINKFKIAKDILIPYKFIYKYNKESHDLIISNYMNNIDLFINKSLGYLDYLKEVEKNSPFPLIDYYYYLNKYNLINNILLNYNSFNTWYLLLELICRDLSINKGIIVPNKLLSFYIDKCIEENDFNSLDIILLRIEGLNKRGMELLLEDSIAKLINKGLELENIFKLLEYLKPEKSLPYFKRVFNKEDKYKLIDIITKRGNIHRDYYDRLFKLIAKEPELSFLIELKDKLELKGLGGDSLDILDSYYKSYYLNRYNNDYGAFLDKVLEYLNKKNDINIGIDIYNRYYKKLDNSYKDTIASIEKINDYLNKFENTYSDTKYLAILDELNNRLIKGHKGANSYYAFLKIGEGLKGKSANNIIKDIITYGYPKNDIAIIERFNKYYLATLLDKFFIYLNDVADGALSLSFKRVLKPLSIDRSYQDIFINYLNNKKGSLFYVLLIGSSRAGSSLRLILNKALANLKGAIKREYLRDYLEYLNKPDNSYLSYKNEAILFIKDYIKNNLSIIDKLLLKLKL